ncbi:MAG: aldose epimerase family protein [Pseudomonadota bacterium]
MSDFGTAKTGEPVSRITISAGDLTASILTFGAILQDVRLDGVDYGLTLGADDLEAYEGPYNSFGSVIGPVANRISHARAVLDGKELTFEANMGGVHNLHSGAVGTRRKHWQVVDQSNAHVTLRTAAPDGEGGFPGNRTWTARYDISAPASLTLTLTAATDAPTLMNTVNHSYWNLDGTANYNGHTLRLAADRYLPVNEVLLPTGDIMPVDDTLFDYRTAKPIVTDSLLDHNFCLSDERRPIRPVAWLTGKSGLQMEMATTEPGLQVYGGDTIRNDGFPGHHGAPYGPYSGLALEAQFWPDAPHNPAFPSIRLDPGQDWCQVTRWSFSAEK